MNVFRMRKVTKLLLAVVVVSVAAFSTTYLFNKKPEIPEKSQSYKKPLSVRLLVTEKPSRLDRVGHLVINGRPLEEKTTKKAEQNKIKSKAKREWTEDVSTVQVPFNRAEFEHAEKLSIAANKSAKLQFGKFVHFDFKGAPPRVDFILNVFQLISKLGATGLLLEWEDMFPYTGELEIAKNSHAYSKAEVKLMLDTAKSLNLQVIPLIQTFGHFEWVLKLQEFAHLREVDRFSQTICVSKPESIKLLKDMIRQVMAVHSDAQLLHLGMDEAFQVGECQLCKAAVENSQNGTKLSRKEKLWPSKDFIIAKHMSTMARYARKAYKVRVLVWHDMIVHFDKKVINKFQLATLVEPVVWSYQETFDGLFKETVFNRFLLLFKRVWAGSAFKGANKPDSYFVANSHYLENHMAWLSALQSRSLENYDRFQGFMVTGWSRYDHFAVLCELLPAAIPSLTLNMLILQAGNYTPAILESASDILHCSSVLSLNYLGQSKICKFPGSSVHQLISKLHFARRDVQEFVYESQMFQGWMSPYAVRYNFSSSWYLDQIIDKLTVYAGNMRSIGKQLRSELELLYFPDAVDEFMFEQFQPHMDRLKDLLKSSRSLASRRSFPARPLMI